MNAAQQSIAQRIFAQAIAGTPNNPGLPTVLAQFVAGQSYNETNGWTSNFYVNYNAGFGYECDPGSEYQSGCSATNADNKVKVGAYNSIEDSTKEVVDWIYRRIDDGRFPSDLTTITSADQYATLLHNAGYFTSSASGYANRINQFLSQMGSLFPKR